MIGDRTRIVAIGWTLVAAFCGGGAAALLGLPLPWMLGPLLLIGMLALLRVQVAGTAPDFPIVLRQIALPVIGVMIGSVVPPDIFRQLLTWWPSLAMIVPFVIIVQLLNYQLFRRLGGYDRPTAFFAASPGGLVEAVVIGESQGGNPALMSIQHLGRVALSLTFVPLLYLVITGDVVGSAAGLTLEGPAPGPVDLALLLAAGGIGYAIGRMIRLPAAIVVGPLLVSAAIHAGGLTAAGVPILLVQSAQLVIGTTIGLRFLGQPPGLIIRGFGLSILAVGIGMVCAFLLSITLAGLGIASQEALFLSYAPGGLAEMSLVAISLGVSPMFVALHHVARIMLAVIIGPAIYARFIATDDDPPVSAK